MEVVVVVGIEEGVVDWVSRREGLVEVGETGERLSLLLLRRRRCCWRD
jgi:hypothetical protein